MYQEITIAPHRDIIPYDPDKALEFISLAEAGERHYRRAKDVTGLRLAIDVKLPAQGAYVCWRDRIPVLPDAGPGRGHKNRISVLKRGLPENDPGNVVVHRWRKAVCTKGPTGTVIDEDKLARAVEDALNRCQRIVEQEPGVVHGTQGTGEIERYTPAKYIAMARKVMGEIDLDPASDDEAQKTVQARQYYTKADDGLRQIWKGRLWVNAPYNGLLPKFVAKLIREFQAGNVTAAVMLTNNSTDTAWFHKAMNTCSSVCFPRGRISFIDSDGHEMGTPPTGQVFFYFGPDVEGFEQVFSKIGRCVSLSRQSESHSLIPPNGNDRVMTPDDLALKIVEHFKGQIKGGVLEPCAGQGAFVRALQRTGYRPLELELDRGSDFFAFHEQVDWIITNPPWSKIREFACHAYEVAHDIVVLISLNHLFVLKARYRDMLEAGFWIKEIVLVDTPASWPQSGFQLAAVHLQKGWTGDTKIGCLDA